MRLTARLRRIALTTAVAGILAMAAFATTAAAWPPAPELLHDINPGVADSFAEMFVPFNNNVYFRADDGEHGIELWRTDGTFEGTQLVTDLRPGPANGFPTNMASVHGRLYFNAYNTAEGVGSKVFVSDGTAEGIVLLADTWPDLPAMFDGPPLPGNFTALGGNSVLFTATGPDDGNELWRTDGTPAGTTRVKDIHPGVEWSIPIGLTSLDGVICFAADDSFVEQNGFRIYDRELWRSDGTEAGTFRVADINPGFEPSTPVDFRRFGQEIFFRANDGLHGAELWKTDGSTEGTALVADINPGSLSSDLQDLTIFGNRFVFFANNGTSGNELFISDGTADGTGLIKDINPTGNADPYNLTVLGDRLFFSADDGVNGRELWVTDGTEAGTQIVANLNGAEPSSPDSLSVVGQTLFFTTIVPDEEDDTVQTQLWLTDGTADGTKLVFQEPGKSTGYAITNLTALGNKLLFTAPTDVDELGFSTNTELYAVTIPEPPAAALAGALLLLPVLRRWARQFAFQ